MRHPCPAILPWGVPDSHHLVTKLHLGVVHYAAHKGRIVLAANHQHLVILHHHIALQVLKDDHLVGTDIEEIVVAAIEQVAHIAGNIAVGVLLLEVLVVFPRANVGPAEIARGDIHIGMVLQYQYVN